MYISAKDNKKKKVQSYSQIYEHQLHREKFLKKQRINPKKKSHKGRIIHLKNELIKSKIATKTKEENPWAEISIKINELG
jgi:hypothetical protein